MDVTAIAVVFATLLYFLVHYLVLRYKELQRTHAINLIEATIAGYFSKSGMQISVSCPRLADDGRLIVLIESEPLKKFRLSYVIEQALTNHVLKVTGRQIERIYWRFPLQDKEVAKEVQTSQPAKRIEPDAYIAQGMAQIQEQSSYEVDETSLENYESALHSGKPGGEAKPS